MTPFDSIARNLAALVLLGLAAAPAFAEVKLTTTVMQQKSGEGTSDVKLIPVKNAAPGSEVVYVIRFENKGAKPADNVVITNPLPAELAYRGADTAVQGTKFEVSVDGGKIFGVLTSLAVRGADGTTRPAQPNDVTHVRWTFLRAVAGGESGEVSYQALLK